MPEETFQLTHQHLLFVLLLVVLFLFAACSSAPSESEAKKVWADRNKGQDLYRLKSLTKTNGISDERTYTMEIETEIECLKSNEVAPGMFRGYNIQCQNKGQIVKEKATLVFEKTENGWRIKP